MCLFRCLATLLIEVIIFRLQIVLVLLTTVDEKSKTGKNSNSEKDSNGSASFATS